MIVWLWEAGSRFSGITDDPDRAREIAAGVLLRGDNARVELAMCFLGDQGYAVYFRAGEGWTAIRPWEGPLTWQPIPVTSKASA